LHKFGGDAVKRTRKWAFVAQEARRLADLGLTPQEIAKRLGEGVNRSTVQRWMAAGKIRDNRRGAKGEKLASFTLLRKPSEWATDVRKEYALDSTDDQLVTLAESALGISLDVDQPKPVRLNAMRTYQGLVKQLSLITRAADKPETPAKPDAPVARAGATCHGAAASTRATS
jgi:hypothetical protein